ncbi:MAG TPA: sigma-70 family RNA polymerase sigma factor [Thermoanaerobaculia bacterium]|nr:sigma-70 family RNA polymerase sigma factor [Thermoanaerobaculia bacterium]
MQQPSDGVMRAEPPPELTGGGAADAFEEAYLRYAPRLQRIAIARFGVPAQDVEVLVQDVFMTYFQHKDDVESPERYLVGAICNASRNFLRKAGTSKALFSEEEPCAATSVDELLNELERKHLLAQMLGRIGGRCREMLHRFYINDEGTDTIASELGLARGSVKVMMFKCRQRALDAYRAIMERS